MQHKLTVLLINLSVIAALFICCSADATDKRWAQLSQPIFQTVAPDSGLLDGPIRTVTEDGNGFIWLLESSRLWRWDAHELLPVVASVSPRNAPRTDKSSAEDVAPAIQSLQRDAAGKIWVGTNRGLYFAHQDTPGAPTLVRVDNAALNQLSIGKNRLRQ